MISVQIAVLLLGLIVFLVLCFWFGLIVRLWKMASTKATICEGLQLTVDPEITVSIVVPAHNEERVIDCCVKSLRMQTHQAIEIIFVLDRCSDQTLPILEAHAKEDSRIRIIENDSCPDNWAGKCNAARLGSEVATGDWILFADADTKFDRDLVRCAIASAKNRGASLLSLLSSLTTKNTFEKLVQPVASTYLVRLYPVDRINRKENPRPFANGQFLLFEREAYELIGGHYAVKDDLLEDIAFARAIHKAQRRVQVLFSEGMLQCSMYPTFQSFKEGWQRIYIEACHRNMRRLRKSALLVILMNIVFPFCSIAGLVLGVFHSMPLLIISIASFMMYFLAVGWLYKMNYAPVFYTIYAPIGAVIVAKIFWDAAMILACKKPIHWGGREYILEPTTR